MADRNPILKPVTDPGVQFAPEVQQQAIYDASLSGGGVAALDNVKKGKVVSYTSSTRTGTVTIDGANVPFRDATLRLLIAGDNIALARLYNDAQDWVCVGVLSPDSGSGLAPNIGVATISTGFPINTNAIPFPINPTFGGFSNTTSFPFTALAYDMNNALGYGSDCIIGFPSGSASINLLSRTTGTATSLYTAPTGLGDAVNFWVQSNGRMIFWTSSQGQTYTGVNSTTIYYRDAGAASWITVTCVQNTATFDSSTGYLWYYRSGVGWYKYAATDASPVLVSFATSVVPTQAATEVIASRGKLVVHISGQIYHKNSNDTVNWTTGGTYSVANWESPQVTFYRSPSAVADSSGNSYYIRNDGTTTTWHIRKVSVSGVVSDTDLNISTSVYDVGGYFITNTGNLLFYGTSLASAFGGSGTSYVGYIAVFDFTASTTVFVWNSSTRLSTVSRANVLVNRPYEISTGIFRWGARNYDPATDEFWIYEGTI